MQPQLLGGDPELRSVCMDFRFKVALKGAWIIRMNSRSAFLVVTDRDGYLQRYPLPFSASVVRVRYQVNMVVFFGQQTTSWLFSEELYSP